MTNDHIHERLAILETNMKHLDECVDDAKAAIRELEKTVWKASGAITIFFGSFELLLKFVGH